MGEALANPSKLSGFTHLLLGPREGKQHETHKSATWMVDLSGVVRGMVLSSAPTLDKLAMILSMCQGSPFRNLLQPRPESGNVSGRRTSLAVRLNPRHTG